MTEDRRRELRKAINSAADYIHDATRWDQQDENDDDGTTPMDRLVDRIERIYLIESSTQTTQVDTRVLCDRCDGFGWYEGGTALMTVCDKCNGTGVIEV